VAKRLATAATATTTAAAIGRNINDRGQWETSFPIRVVCTTEGPRCIDWRRAPQSKIVHASLFEAEFFALN
jgi:hypothetical protein